MILYFIRNPGPEQIFSPGPGPSQKISVPNPKIRIRLQYVPFVLQQLVICIQ